MDVWERTAVRLHRQDLERQLVLAAALSSLKGGYPPALSKYDTDFIENDQHHPRGVEKIGTLVDILIDRRGGFDALVNALDYEGVHSPQLAQSLRDTLAELRGSKSELELLELEPQRSAAAEAARVVNNVMYSLFACANVPPESTELLRNEQIRVKVAPLLAALKSELLAEVDARQAATTITTEPTDEQVDDNRTSQHNMNVTGPFLPPGADEEPSASTFEITTTTSPTATTTTAVTAFSLISQDPLALFQEMRKAGEAVAKYQYIKAQLTSLSVSKSKCEAQLDKALQDLEISKAEKETPEATAYADLAKMHADLEAQIVDLSAELSQCRQELDQTRQKLLTLEMDKKAAETKVTDLITEHEMLKRTFASSEKEKSALATMRTAAEAFNIQLKRDLAESGSANNQLKAELAEQRLGMEERKRNGETPIRTSFQSSAKGNVSIAECNPEGKFIVLENTNRNKEESMDEWKLKRKIDGKKEVVFSLPAKYVLKPGKTVKVWARGQGGTHSPPDALVFDGEDNWGHGHNVDTILYNKDGEVRAHPPPDDGDWGPVLFRSARRASSALPIQRLSLSPANPPFRCNTGVLTLLRCISCRRRTIC